MKITKFMHACLLVEADGRVGLIDPGNYSWDSGLFDLSKIDQIDDIIITHEHPDHMHLPFIEAVVAKFPKANIITTQSAKQKLESQGISGVTSESNEFIEFFVANHESVEPLFTAPQNIGVNYMDKLSHPGDSHHFDASKQVLALPITAPWGTVAMAAELGIKLKPEYIIPIHDWHFRDEARAGIYGMLESFFSQHGIKFIKPVDGQAIDLDI